MLVSSIIQYNWEYLTTKTLQIEPSTNEGEKLSLGTSIFGFGPEVMAVKYAKYFNKLSGLPQSCYLKARFKYVWLTTNCFAMLSMKLYKQTGMYLVEIKFGQDRITYHDLNKPKFCMKIVYVPN